MARYSSQSRSRNKGGGQQLKRKLSSARRASANNARKAKNYKYVALGLGVLTAFNFIKK